MSTPLPFLTTRAVAMPIEFFSALRSAAQDPNSPSAVMEAVRDAGYHAGAALYDGFDEWLSSRGEAAPETITDARFGRLLSEYLMGAGWGHITLTALSEAVMALDADDWTEARGERGGCMISTGLFAGFFGRLAEAPIAVLEVECRNAGDPRCRFLLGSEDVLGYLHEAMTSGASYEMAALSA